jgi:hypothetical protein
MHCQPIHAASFLRGHFVVDLLTPDFGAIGCGLTLGLMKCCKLVVVSCREVLLVRKLSFDGGTAMSFLRSTVIGLRVVSGSQRKLSRPNVRRLSLENLEDRRMLAVGSFERSGGAVTSYAWAGAAVASGEEIDTAPQKYLEVFAKSDAQATAIDGGGFGFAFVDGIGYIPVPIGASLAAPFVNAKLGAEYTAEGNALGRILKQSTAAASAAASFEYLEDPLNSNDLTLHVHLYIVANGGATVSGDATLMGGLHLEAGINDTYSIEATSIEETELNDWYVSGTLPTIGEFSFTSSGGVNEHRHFVLPGAGGVVLNALTGPDVDGGPWADALDGLIQGVHGLTAAAWAYVTEEGQDVDEGDFNADGNVDAADYDLWKNGDPRADADLDADIDMDDYDIWAGATTAIIVTSEDPYGGPGTLSDAIGQASTNPGPDEIVFDPSVDNVISPESAFVIDSDLTIDGPGSDLLTISGGYMDRVFVISGGTVTIRDVTITDGSATGDGGGISSISADLTLDHVVVANNFVDEGVGAGIFSSEGSLTITDSTIENNSFGSGIYAADADVSIIRSTISGNSGGAGGLKFTGVGQTLIISNSTISGNYGQNAGGIEVINENGTVYILNSTITNNIIHSSGSAGGLVALAENTTVKLDNTIIANNRRVNNSQSDILLLDDAIFDSASSHNLIGYDPNELFPSGNGNIIGVSSAINPRLAPLDNYGGPTKTHALLYDSPAINAGDDDVYDEHELLFLLTDQRGAGYDRLDWGGDAHVDIGAFELAIDEMYS